MDLELDMLVSSQPEHVTEPSVLEYAREQGICSEYTAELPFLVRTCTALRHGNDYSPWAEFDDEVLRAGVAARGLRERLAVGRDAAVLLKSVIEMRDPPPLDTLMEERGVRDLKLELPLLATDVEMDLVGFGRRVEIEFEEIRAGIPSEDFEDVEEGEWAGAREVCEGLVREKLGVSREGVRMLESVVRGEFEIGVVETVEERRELVQRYLTPPLLPLSPPLTPYVPSSPANRLPLLPESSDPVAAEAKALENTIMTNDSLLRQHSTSSDSMLLDLVAVDSTDVQEAATPDRIPAILKSKRKADELKVEGPLTPEILSDSPMKKLKSVAFVDMVQVRDSMQSWLQSSPVHSSDSQSTTDQLAKVIDTTAEEVIRAVENEKLTGADTISRVDIPVLDFTLPIAPWDEYSHRREKKRHLHTSELEAQMRFLQCVKRDDLRSVTTWRGVSDLDLKWGWFATPVSSIQLDEKLHGEQEFEKIQAEIKTGSIATSADGVWKKEGLRVLDKEDEEDDVEALELEEQEQGQNDVEGMIWKRKREAQEHEQEALTEGEGKRHQAAAVQAVLTMPPELHGGVEVSCQQVWPSLGPDLRTAHHRMIASALLPSQDNFAGERAHASSDSLSGGFSASTALHKFMETQGKIIKAVNVVEQTSNTAPAHQSHSARNREPSTESSVSITQMPVQKPLLPLNLPACSFVVSTLLLQRRQLLKQIESLHGNAELIYRDYTLPHSPAAEADIILSPSTGLLLTTLQQIKQAPLPGQAARSPVKERILTLQNRYERLIILVSEGLREETGYTRPEDARDKEALHNLEALAVQLEGDVSVTYIPGGEQTLASAIVADLGRCGLPHGGKDINDITLFAMETTWELFLRTAGINPFAAQVILGSLKVPTTIAIPTAPAQHAQRSIEAVGLSRFLLMQRGERTERFQAVMGGRRILERVSKVLDRGWVSASNGFKMESFHA